MPNEVRRTENEYLLQSMNENVAEKVKHIAPGKSGERMSLNFRCECSDLNCDKYISLRIDEYQSIIRKPGQFVVFPSHEQLDIESAMVSNSQYTIVEKHIELINKVA